VPLAGMWRLAALSRAPQMPHLLSNMTALLASAREHLVIAARAAGGGRGVGAVLKVERRRLERLGHAGVQLEAGAAQQLVTLRQQPVVRRDQPAAVLLQLLRTPGTRRI
jgi:hypothetical protein